MTGDAPRFVSVNVCTPPFDVGPVCPSPSEILLGVTETGALIALSTCTRPAPCRAVESATGPRSELNGTAVFSIAAATSANVGSRPVLALYACMKSATVPATCGDAIEVPLIVL